MSRVKIQNFNENNSNGETKSVRTVWIDKDSVKKLTAKKAGQILANNFPAFDNSSIRNGLIKTENGFRAMRTLEPTEKCDYHYIWEYAIVSEENTK